VCQIGYVEHTGCQLLVSPTMRASSVLPGSHRGAMFTTGMLLKIVCCCEDASSEVEVAVAVVVVRGREGRRRWIP
jgi:hypothetical protein